MSDDVEALAEVLRVADDDALVRTNFGQIVILTSDWLAAYVAAARAEEREAALVDLDAMASDRDAAELETIRAKAETADWVNAYNAELVRRKALERSVVDLAEDLRPREGA